jgi:hypothetical protein
MTMAFSPTPTYGVADFFFGVASIAHDALPYSVR